MLALLVTAAAMAASPTLQVGLTAPYAVQPGMRIGLRQPIRTWDGRKSTAALIVGGDIASYVNFGNHMSGLGGGTAGVRWQRDGGFGLAVEGGLAAVADYQTLGVAVDLGSGELTPDREWRVWLVPTVAGRLSWRGDERIGAYTGLSVGPEIGFGRDGALTFTVDAGLRVRLGAGAAQ